MKVTTQDIQVQPPSVTQQEQKNTADSIRELVREALLPYLVVFPALILLALWSSDEKHPRRKDFLLPLFASFQAVFMIFFVLGLPAIA